MTTQRAELQRFSRDMRYFSDHWEELLTQYPEQWIAIFNEEVAGSAPDFDQLLAELQMRGIPPEQAFVEYVTEKEELLIVPVVAPR
jgi:hypothetical protein